MTVPTQIVRVMRRQILSVGMTPLVDERRADAAMPEVGLDPVVDLLDHDTGAALLEAARCLSGKDGWGDPAAVLHSAALLVGDNRPAAPLDAARRLLADGRQECPASLPEAVRLLLGKAHPDATALREDLARRLVAYKLAERKAAGSPGRAPAGYVDVVAAGPPRYGEPDAWPAQRVLAFGKATLDFTRTRFPYSFLVQAYVHQDGAAPYVRLTCVPVGPTGRLGWNAVRPDLPGGNHRVGMKALLDSFHEDVARKFGLGRGGRSRWSRGKDSPAAGASGPAR